MADASDHEASTAPAAAAKGAAVRVDDEAHAFLESIPTVDEANSALRALGYECLDGDRITKVGSSGAEGFEFSDQGHYDALSKATQQLIYAMMKHRSSVPLVPFTVSRMRRRKGESVASRCAVQCWRTPGALTTPGPVLVLLQGSGAVRPGVWAMSVCINSGLRSGGMLPWVDAAAARGWECVVLNPNAGNPGGSAAHAAAAWRSVLCELPASQFLVLAHSRGGVGAAQLLREPGALARITAVAMTDAVHDGKPTDPARMREALAARCVDWRRSPADLDPSDAAAVARWERAATLGDGIPVRPAMTPHHVWTTAKTFKPVMAWLDEMLAAAQSPATA